MIWVENHLNEDPSRIGVQENFIKKAVFTSCETASFFSNVKDLLKQSFYFGNGLINE